MFDFLLTSSRRTTLTLSSSVMMLMEKFRQKIKRDVQSHASLDGAEGKKLRKIVISKLWVEKYDDKECKPGGKFFFGYT